jgi:hypothetical protein
MRRGLVVLLGFLCMGVFSAQALAQTKGETPPPATGYIEVCKASAPAPLAVTGPFSFTITDPADNTYNVTVSVGLCSAPIQVVSGTNVIQETAGDWYHVISIAGLPGQNYLVAPTTASLAGGYAYVNVPPSADSVSGTATVTFTNQLDPGVIEICKAAVAGSGLTGSYSFAITGNDGFSATATAQAGSCTLPISVPAGKVTVQEAAPLFVTGITAISQGASVLDLVNTDIAAGTAVFTVQPGDVSNQTSVTFTDNVTTLKLCKVWNGPAPYVSYPFSFGVSGAAGPNGPTAPISLMAGTVNAPNCVVVGQYRAGTLVTITEGVVPGTKVTANGIVVNGAGSVVAGSLSIPDRTVTISMAGDNSGGLTEVTYTNVPADPGWLKICKLAGTPPPTGTSFVFTIGAISVTVPVGQCVNVPGTFPYNSTQTIVETLAGDLVQAIGVAPTFVTQDGALTTHPVLAGPPNLATGTVSVVIGEATTTEVTYTDTDPPKVPVVSPPTSGGSSGGGSSGTPSTSPPAVTPPAAPASVPPVATPTVVKAKLVFANLVTTKLGKVLQVRVTGPNATATIKITLLGKNGKVLKVVTKTVPTNKLVRVAGLSISKATVAARVTVVQ